MKHRLLLLILISGFISGCAWGDRHPMLTYSPVANVQNKNNIVVKIVNFDDKRPVTNTVGYSRNAWGMRCAKVVPQNNVADWVTNALKAELERSGYTVASGQDSSSNVISGEVYQVFCDTYMDYQGSIGIKVTLQQD